jgi:hypothetical protein
LTVGQLSFCSHWILQPRAEDSWMIEKTGMIESKPSTVWPVAAALAKLAQLEAAPDDPTTVAFACGHAHDELLGVLLLRALNLRQALREEELSASRGVLAAPSAQAAAP